MTTYNPQNSRSREALADSILATLTASGFEDQTHNHPRSFERIFGREIPTTNPPVRVLVYTSVDVRTQAVRETGKDAIRVCAVVTVDDQTRGVVKTTRIHRVGKVGAINDRLLERMRTAYSEGRDFGRNPHTCRKCKAVMFITKKGKPCCSKLCWK